MPQLVPGYPFGIQNPHQGDSLPFAGAGYGLPAPVPYHANPLPFQRAEPGFPPQAPHIIPQDVLEQRKRTLCRHFEHHLGWCPYGAECHFLHDHSRLPSRASSTSPSHASSAASSLRSSPVPFIPWYPRGASYRAAFAPPPPPRLARHHEFTTRTIGGTTYFPIRLDESRLGYMTPNGVEVFTNI
ncbi:hypothetical protein BC826DRAFT_974604 [Russula brevipes]|nr:hypothetical protein BC826DRAFT_974604 [Russula brevipes]